FRADRQECGWRALVVVLGQNPIGTPARIGETELVNAALVVEVRATGGQILLGSQIPAQTVQALTGNHRLARVLPIQVQLDGRAGVHDGNVVPDVVIDGSVGQNGSVAI